MNREGAPDLAAPSAMLSRSGRHGTAPHASGLHDDEPPGEAARSASDEAHDLGRERTARRSRVAEKQHARRAPGDPTSVGASATRDVVGAST